MRLCGFANLGVDCEGYGEGDGLRLFGTGDDLDADT